MFKRVLYSGCIGTTLEWYDFCIYAYAATLLSVVFFPQNDRFLSLIFSYSIFAAGYFMRPVGGLVFGHFGDTIGRKKALAATIIIMSLATAAMGLLPTYQSAGVWAPLLLLVFRLIQGFAIGGESLGASCFVVESAPSKKQGLVAALTWACSAIGFLLASFAIFIVTQCFSGPTLYTIGWRIPFLLGIITGIIGLYVRLRTIETFTTLCESANKKIVTEPILHAARSYKKLTLKLAALYLLSALATYLIFVFMPLYISTILKGSLSNVIGISSGMMLLLAFLDVFFGYLSDKHSPRKLMMISACGFIAFSYPLYLMILHLNYMNLIAAFFVFTVLSASFQGPLTILVLRSIPIHLRYTIGSFAYNFSYCLFGGTAPLVATYLIHWTNNKAAPGIYLSLGALVALIALWRL